MSKQDRLCEGTKKERIQRERKCARCIRISSERNLVQSVEAHQHIRQLETSLLRYRLVMVTGRLISSEGITQESEITLIGDSALLFNRLFNRNIVEIFDWEVLSIDAGPAGHKTNKQK